MKIGIADYGLNVWEGGGSFDPEERWLRLKQLGYEGVERLTASSGDHALAQAAAMKRLGLDFMTVRGPSHELSIRWTAAFGKRYVWTWTEANDFDAVCRQARLQAAACERWGIRVALHNHMGTPVETHEQVERFLAECPDAQLVLDTAHLAAIGGDPVEIAGKYADRLAVLHVKDYVSLNPGDPSWTKRGRFCELGGGNIGLDNAAVIRAAVKGGFDGWVFVEQDTHLQDPFVDLAVSRQYLRDAGY
jgi:sugar phosphate isomerase/epimerase